MAGINMKYCPLCANRLLERIVDTRRYQACAECEFTHWNNPVPVVAAIVELNEKVVLAHNKAWPAKMLALITGFLEQKESPDSAIEREVKEELGLDAIHTSLVGVYPFEQQNQVIIAYHVKCTGDIVLGDELDSYKLIEPSKLKPWRFGTGPAVEDWLASRKLNT